MKKLKCLLYIGFKRNQNKHLVYGCQKKDVNSESHTRTRKAGQ